MRLVAGLVVAVVAGFAAGWFAVVAIQNALAGSRLPR